MIIIRINIDFWLAKSIGGASVRHFQQFVSLTANIGRFSQELADLQDSMRSVRTFLNTPSDTSHLAALTF